MAAPNHSRPLSLDTGPSIIGCFTHDSISIIYKIKNPKISKYFTLNFMNRHEWLLKCPYFRKKSKATFVILNVYLLVSSWNRRPFRTLRTAWLISWSECSRLSPSCFSFRISTVNNFRPIMVFVGSNVRVFGMFERGKIFLSFTEAQSKHIQKNSHSDLFYLSIGCFFLMLFISF